MPFGRPDMAVDRRASHGQRNWPTIHRPRHQPCWSGRSRSFSMDLGIAGRKAIVCASSRGLGRACAMRLAEAGCEVVVNGRDAARLDATAADIRKATGAKVYAVVADVATPEGQASLFAVCPEPDILIA